MAFTRRYSESLQAYEAHFETVIPDGVRRSAPVVEQTEELQKAAEQAIATGEPIQDWRRFVVRSEDYSKLAGATEA